MSAFTRGQRRFDCLGVQLSRSADNCDPGKWPVLVNVRSQLAGTLQPREGLIPVPNGAFADPIHTISRFDDTSRSAAQHQLYIVGEGANLHVGTAPNGPFVLADTGYTGIPLFLTEATPPQAPNPWVYVADVNRMRKLDANGHVYRQGIAAPTAEPSTALQALGTNVIQSVLSAPPWQMVGTGVSAFDLPSRVNTTIDQHLFDAGTSGYVSIVPVSMVGISAPMLLAVNGSSNNVLAITEVTIAVATTEITAIVYDSGSTGLCTIQPTASLGIGQTATPTIRDQYAQAGIEYGVPRGTQASPPAGPTAPDAAGSLIFRQPNFPVDCLISLGNTETVRILSVAVGRDGVQSFRCRTTSTHGAGESIVGLPAFRAYSPVDIVNGQSLIDVAQGFTITTAGPISPQTTPPTLPQATGGLRHYFATPLNLALINGRATLPDDDVYCAIRADLAQSLNTVRIYLSVETSIGAAPATTDFTQNYFFFEWRQSDIALAIQNTNTQTVQTIQQVRQTVVSNQQLNEVGSDGRPTLRAALAASRARQGFVDAASGTGKTRVGAPNTPAAATTSAQLALGNNQWLALHCKVRDLTRIGTDTSKTLANVTGAEVLVNVVGTATAKATVQVAVDAVWLAGGYEPDMRSTGVPYVYRYRYRSSLTGGVSNGSPQTRGGVIPQRQGVLATGTASSDAQVDLMDWFKLGGAIDRWTYAGTVPNSTASFLDIYNDGALIGGARLDFDNFPPFPTQDLARTGVCSVVGSAIVRVSGDLFNVNWAPGSYVIINNQTYTIYSVPSTGFIFLNENAGSGSAQPFTVPGATLLEQNFGSQWGGPIGGATYLFGCRDPINPGQVHWTKGNNPEASSDKGVVDVTTGADRLQAGFMWDGVSFVASTEQLYVLEPSLDPLNPFRPVVTPCGRGFWTPSSYCVAPEGVYFLAKDGIFITSGGSPAVSITDADLYPLFQHDGMLGQPVNGFYPVNMQPVAGPTVSGPSLPTTEPTGQFCITLTCAGPSGPTNADVDLRLAYIDGYVIFDYVDTLGFPRTMSYRVADKSWWPDVYDPGLKVHESSVGKLVHEALIGGDDGQLYVQGGFTDNGNPYTYQWQIVENQQDARRYKLYRDVFLKADLTGATATVAVSFTDQGTVLPPSTLVGLSGVNAYLIDTVPQTGIYGTNITIAASGQPVSVTSPLWEVLDLAYQLQPELASSWLSGPTTHGLRGFQEAPRALIAYLSNGPVTLSVIIDGQLFVYDLPSTGGQYAKNQVVLQAVKGKTFQWGMQGSPFLLFDRDMELWISVWGQSGGYQIARPF